jgi:hypothetical protein
LRAYSNPYGHRDTYGNSNAYWYASTEGYSYTAAAADAGSSVVVAVAASLCEAQNRYCNRDCRVS